MPRILPIIRKVAGGGPPSAGFIASVVRAGVNLANRISLLGAEQRPTVAMDATRHTARAAPHIGGVAASPLGAVGSSAVDIRAAFDIDASLRSAGNVVATGPAAMVTPSLRAVDPVAFAHNPAVTTQPIVSGLAARPGASPAPALSPVISEFHKDNTPAGEIVQVKYDLTRRVGADTQAAVGTAWTNPGNATGANNGVSATSAGSATGNTQGVELSYADAVNKNDLTITEVRLFVYLDITDPAGLCTRTISYNIGGGLVTLETGTGAVDYLPTPKQFVLPITTWAQFNALVARVVTAYAALSALSNAALDAIEVQVLATRTEIPI